MAETNDPPQVTTQEVVLGGKTFKASSLWGYLHDTLFQSNIGDQVTGEAHQVILELLDKHPEKVFELHTTLSEYTSLGCTYTRFCHVVTLKLIVLMLVICRTQALQRCTPSLSHSPLSLLPGKEV
jgi:hypothetical protein